jgi:hypothetical protein
METIRWDYSGFETRKAVCELVGWRNKKGNATPTGLKIARTSWEKLSEAAKNVLIRHGIIQ